MKGSTLSLCKSMILSPVWRLGDEWRHRRGDTYRYLCKQIWPAWLSATLEKNREDDNHSANFVFHQKGYMCLSFGPRVSTCHKKAKRRNSRCVLKVSVHVQGEKEREQASNFRHCRTPFTVSATGSGYWTKNWSSFYSMLDSRTRTEYWSPILPHENLQAVSPRRTSTKIVIDAMWTYWYGSQRKPACSLVGKNDEGMSPRESYIYSWWTWIHFPILIGSITTTGTSAYLHYVVKSRWQMTTSRNEWLCFLWHRSNRGDSAWCAFCSVRAQHAMTQSSIAISRIFGKPRSPIYT